MGIYATKPATTALNILCASAGKQLVKISHENSNLHTERVELLEKVAEQDATIRAYKQAVAEATRGRLSAAAITVKVAELLNVDTSVVESQSSEPQALSSFATTKTSGAKVASDSVYDQKAMDRHNRFFANLTNSN